MKLQQVRKRHGLSLRQLDQLSGVHFVTIAKIEAGEIDPRLSTLRKLAKALKISLSELVGDLSTTKHRRK